LHKPFAKRARAQDHLPRPVGDIGRGIERIHHQIEKDLLQLDAISGHQRQPGRQVERDRHVPLPSVATLPNATMIALLRRPFRQTRCCPAIGPSGIGLWSDASRRIGDPTRIRPTPDGARAARGVFKS